MSWGEITDEGLAEVEKLIGVPLRKSIEQQLPEFLMDIYGNGPQIKLAELGEDAVPVGALLL